jgi:hypothetical protein
VDATRSLEKILAEPAGLSPADVQRARTLREAQEARVGTLTVETNIPGARIYVDGQEVATTPLAAPRREAIPLVRSRDPCGLVGRGPFSPSG